MHLYAYKYIYCFFLSLKLIFSNAVRCVKSVQIHINLGVWVIV